MGKLVIGDSIAVGWRNVSLVAKQFTVTEGERASANVPNQLQQVPRDIRKHVFFRMTKDRPVGIICRSLSTLAVIEP
jgi:hypothetical protein